MRQHAPTPGVISSKSRKVLRLGSLLGAFLALLLLLASQASAAPARASLADPIGGFALNKACGSAVDSQGDIYVASAGNSKIEVFDPSGALLASIADANSPCGLAVNSKGALYVSEQSTGKVVEYTPNAYPFSGTLSYGSPSTVDPSGSAKGISVDPTDDRLYVAEGNRISTYDAEGNLGINEQQRVFPFRATGGSFKLSFGGQETEPIAFDASHAEVQAALESLSTIGAGNVTVTQGPAPDPADHLITFTGGLARTNVEPLTGDGSGLEGAESQLFFDHPVEVRNGFSGHIGEGELTDATAVAAYTYSPTRELSEGPGPDRYVFAADSANNRILTFSGNDLRSLAPAVSIDGTGTPSGSLGFGGQAAALGVDSFTGHFFAYDDAHHMLDEFEASGRYFGQVSSPSFANAGPSGIAVDRSGGENDGDVYLTAGAGAGAKLLAFGPATSPSRPPYVLPSRTPRPDLSHEVKNAAGVGVDSRGDLYVAAGAAIKVYSPAQVPLATITDASLSTPRSLTVDSHGIVYVVDEGGPAGGNEKVLEFKPNGYPLDASPTYGAALTVESSIVEPGGIAVDPLNDHLLIAKGVFSGEGAGLQEYDSAQNGSALLSTELGASVFGSYLSNVAVDSASGDIYVTKGIGVKAEQGIYVSNASASRRLALIDGSGAPGITPNFLPSAAIAVDSSDGDVVAFNPQNPSAQEFEQSGAFAASFGSLPNGLSGGYIAVDNSGGPNDGVVYVSNRNEVSAFGPLRYGEPPVVRSGAADGIGGGAATLHATVDPRGFALTECRFEYVGDAQYKADGDTFASAASAPCAESLGQIGSGSGAVSVDADISGLDPQARYRFRIVAANQFKGLFGAAFGEASLFGPPQLTPGSAQPVSYVEATVRATIDPSGLPTTYRVRYGTSASYGNLTDDTSLTAGDGSVAIAVPLFGLAEGTTYHFQVIAENAAGTVEGPDQTLVTLARSASQPCPNASLRLENNSSSLPDCRAYELVSPADTGGGRPISFTAQRTMSNNWLVDPSGALAGERLTFFSPTALPGTESNGLVDGYHAVRSPAGWTQQLFSPTWTQAGGSVGPGGIAPDQLYSFWETGSSRPESLPPGTYLGTPAGFEPVGQGSLGVDLRVSGLVIGSGARHVVFNTDSPGEGEPVQLEPDAPAPPLGAIYDRTPGGPTHVVSLLPGNVTPTETAVYCGATPDGSVVAFKVGEALYLRIDDTETVKVADGPVTFAGFSEGGQRVFYANALVDGRNPKPADLYAFDVPSRSATEIAPNSRFVNVSADGSHVYFTSTEVLDQAADGTSGADNLYLWDGSGIRLVAVLDHSDLEEFESLVGLLRWISPTVIGADANGISGRANDPSRSTPDGTVFVFQSHAQLTGYENGGHAEIYRYDSAANGGEGALDCVSCDPGGAAAAGDARLELGGGAVVATTIIPNVTDDGEKVFFESEDPLVPEDANSVTDVYEWEAQEEGGCARADGCLTLISSGHSDRPSSLYSMTPSGRDIFVFTLERLIGADIPGSPSIYDAREGGGFPNPVAPAPCQGDSCQGRGSPAPGLPSAASAGFAGAGNAEEGGGKKSRCAKGKVRRSGHCLKAHRKHRKKASKAKGRVVR